MKSPVRNFRKPEPFLVSYRSNEFSSQVRTECRHSRLLRTSLDTLGKFLDAVSI